MPSTIPFTQRLGIILPGPPIAADVPESARIGLINLLSDLISRHYIDGWYDLEPVALYVGRRLESEFAAGYYGDTCVQIIKDMEWHKFYTLCERVYGLLHGAITREEDGTPISTGPIEEAQKYCADAISQLLGEENLAYEFADGIFQRRGHPQTQKSIQRANAILADPSLAPVRRYFNKALQFFNDRPESDVENCVKEAVCALEAFATILFGKKAAKSFDDVIRSKQGNGERQIAPTIADSIIKLRAFRGNAQGVAHAALEGGPVSVIEAELVLNLVASYITYLYDKFPSQEDSIPF